MRSLNGAALIPFLLFLSANGIVAFHLPATKTTASRSDVVDQVAGTTPFVLEPSTRKPTLPIATSARFSTKLNFFFGKQETKTEKELAPPPEPVVIDPDFRVALAFLALGGLLDTIPYIQLTLGPLVTALGVLFLVQTLRLRFVFDETSFELVTVQPLTGEVQSSGENVIVGGANRWAISSIFNYDFFPKGWIDDAPTGPILVYFKEDQTPQESWNDGPGKIANDPEKIAAGIAKPGQVHFFPAIANSQQLREEFAKRGCKKI